MSIATPNESTGTKVQLRLRISSIMGEWTDELGESVYGSQCVICRLQRNRTTFKLVRYVPKTYGELSLDAVTETHGVAGVHLLSSRILSFH